MITRRGLFRTALGGLAGALVGRKALGAVLTPKDAPVGVPGPLSDEMTALGYWNRQGLANTVPRLTLGRLADCFDMVESLNQSVTEVWLTSSHFLQLHRDAAALPSDKANVIKCGDHEIHDVDCGYGGRQPILWGARLTCTKPDDVLGYVPFTVQPPGADWFYLVGWDGVTLHWHLFYL